MSSSDKHDEQPEPRAIPVWDLGIRLFHWSLAVSVIFMLLSGKTGFGFGDWHKLVGEFVLGLLMFRLLWGIVGSSNVRLVRLIRNPVDAGQHLLRLLRRDVNPERGHNAAGSWAVLIMLGLLLFQAVSGMLIADEEEWVEGAWYGWLNSGVSEELLHLHHSNGTLLLVVAIVHVVMVMLYWLYARQNLISAMITGKMRWSDSSEPPSLQTRSAAFAVFSLLVCLAITAWVSGWFGW